MAGQSRSVPRSEPGEAGAEPVAAEAIEVRQGAIASARAGDIAVTMGAIGIARGGSVSVEMGGAGLAAGGSVRTTQSLVSGVLARDARLEQSLVQTVVAANVVVERPAGVIFLVARRVEGDVRAVFDWRGAIGFGAAFGLVVGLLRRRRRER